MTQPAQVVTQTSELVSQTWVPAQVVVPPRQASASSSQVSVPVHMTPSEQSRALPPQVPAEQTSASVQKRPSSQREPSLSLHALVEVAVVHTSQGLAGLTCPGP